MHAIEDILITDALATRPPRKRDESAERRGLQLLAECMLQDTKVLHRCFAELACELCAAGSAGISMLERADGETLCRWTALAGKFAPYAGGSTRRDFSPCGVCLDRDEPVLLAWPARRFDYFNDVPIPIAEGLIVPLYDMSGEAVGTIWIAAHDDTRKFDATDVAVLQDLAQFFVVTLKVTGDVEALNRQVQQQQTGLVESVRESEAQTARLESAEAALERSLKVETLGQLTGGVVHDFRNLLTALNGCLRLLQREVSGPRSHKLVGLGLEVAQRGEKLVESLLNFARHGPQRRGALDANARIGDLVQMLRSSLGPDIRTETQLADDLWPVRADANQFDMALVNLVLNARDAMAAGGVLTIASGNRSLPSEEGDGLPDSDETDGDFVAISVADSGSGIAPELQQRVFEPFFTTKPQGQGTGLGLSIVAGFARQHGGHVKIVSAVGSGTKVTLLLPRERSGQPAKAAEGKPASAEAAA